MRILNFLYVFFILLIINGCSLFPPNLPEPKGKLMPINLKLHNDNYVIKSEKAEVISPSVKGENDVYTK